MPVQQLVHEAVGFGIVCAALAVGVVLDYGHDGGLAAMDGGLLVFEDDLDTYLCSAPLVSC
jgi:hypothetical protein